MTATEKFFPVVLLILLHKLVLTFEPVDQILMKAPEQLIFVCTDYNASVFAMEHISNNKVEANTESGKPRLFITIGNQALTKGIKRHKQKPRP